MVLKTYRFENGQNHLLYEKINVAELVLNVFDEIEENVAEKNITLALDMNNNKSLIVEADKEYLKIVFTNLISNAILYTNKSEQIKVSISESNNNIRVEITYKGIILSERECMLMFEKTFDSTPKYTTIGHGIALYLCKKIIECHKGQIFATSDGINTNKFIFEIPLKQNKNLSPMATLLHS